MAETFDIKAGYSCNNDCFHCVIADKRRDLLMNTGNCDRTTDDVWEHISEAGRAGAENIILTGGEITIRRDFFELVEHALKNVPHVSIQTNGRMFYYKEFAEKMAKYERTSFTIAVHSDKAEIHDWITGSKGSFHQTTEGIKNLAKLGLGHRIGAKLVVSKKNMDHLAETMEMCQEIGCGSINIAFPHAMGNARLNFYDCVPRYTELKDEILRTTRRSIEIGMHMDWEAVPLCFLTGYETFASELRMSPHAELRDLTHTDNNYTKVRQTTAKRKSPKCSECKYNAICEGVWDDYEDGYDVSELTPVPGPLVTDVRDLPSFNIHPVPVYERKIQTMVSDKGCGNY